MLGKSIAICFCILSLCCFHVFGQQTFIRDSKAKQRLLGKHKLSLQWISWNYFGIANITNKRGVFYLKGEQKQRGGSGFVRIDGKITLIEKTSFTFVGKIETSISHINNGEVCLREGEMIFRITGKRRYWRLMQMDNPCNEVTDYVDIFFR